MAKRPEANGAVPTEAGTRATDADECLALAWARYDAGRLGDAIHMAQQACACAPLRPHGPAALGWFLLEAGKSSDAAQLLRSTLARHPDFAPLHWYLGIVCLREGQLENAGTALTTAVGLDPALDDAAATLAGVLGDLGRLAEATTYARQALAIKAQPDRISRLVWLLFRQRKFDEALAVLADGLALSPDAPDLLALQARILIEAQRPDEARPLIHRLIARQPGQGTHWHLLALALHQRQKHHAAVLALGRARRFAPDQPESWRQAGWWALEAGDLRTARQACQHLLALAPEDPASDILAACVLDASGDLHSAARHAERAIAGARHSADAWRALAQVRYRQDRWPEAEEALHTALDLDPDNTCDAYRQLGWLCHAGRRYEAAIGAFVAATENRPDDAPSWYGLAEARRAAGKQVEALQAVKEALHLRKEWPDAMALRGQIVREQVYEVMQRNWKSLDAAPQVLPSRRAGPPEATLTEHPPDRPASGLADPSRCTTQRPAIGAQYEYLLCSLCTTSHLSTVRTLVASAKRHFSGRIHVLLIDSDDATLLPDGATLVRLDDVIEPAVWQEMAARYNVLELCCTLKSFLMRFLVRRAGCPIIYLDADTYLLAPLDPLLPAHPDFSVFLTPHLVLPLPDERNAEEIGMLCVGAYNGGMIGVGVGDESARFLDWWSARVRQYAYDARQQGVFTDQKWLDMVPSFFRKVHVSPDSGLNVGHWRVCSERDFSEDEVGRLTFCGERVTLMHLSGFNPARPDLLAQHITPPVAQDLPLARFLRGYADEVIRNGWRPRRG